MFKKAYGRRYRNDFNSIVEAASPLKQENLVILKAGVMPFFLLYYKVNIGASVTPSYKFLPSKEGFEIYSILDL